MKLCTIVKYKKIIYLLNRGIYPKDIVLKTAYTIHEVREAQRFQRNQTNSTKFHHMQKIT